MGKSQGIPGPASVAVRSLLSFDFLGKPIVDLSKLETLKNLIIHGQDFSEMFVYFLDYFGDHMAFHRLGEPTANKHIETVVGQAGQSWYNLTVMRVEQRLKRIGEYHFIHGTCKVNDHLLGVVFFEDADVGIMCQCSPAEGQTSPLQFMRFSGRPLRKTRGPSLN